MQTKKRQIFKWLNAIFFITIGAIITGFGLATFLSPNNIIDGGIIGVSMIISNIAHFNLGLLIIILNLPFILMAWKKMGTVFVINTIYANIVLAISLNFFHSYKATGDLLLATVFGGIALGLGVGTILKNDASLDGTEMLS